MDRPRCQIPGGVDVPCGVQRVGGPCLGWTRLPAELEPRLPAGVYWTEECHGVCIGWFM
jgi:hypothetical protein